MAIYKYPDFREESQGNYFEGRSVKAEGRSNHDVKFYGDIENTE